MSHSVILSILLGKEFFSLNSGIAVSMTTRPKILNFTREKLTLPQTTFLTLKWRSHLQNSLHSVYERNTPKLSKTEYSYKKWVIVSQRRITSQERPSSFCGYLITDCVAHSTHLLLLGTWSHWNIYLTRTRIWEDTILGDEKGREENDIHTVWNFSISRS